MGPGVEPTWAGMLDLPPTEHLANEPSVSSPIEWGQGYAEGCCEGFPFSASLRYCFHVLAVMNNVAMNMEGRGQISLPDSNFISSGCITPSP